MSHHEARFLPDGPGGGRIAKQWGRGKERRRIRNCGEEMESIYIQWRGGELGTAEKRWRVYIYSGEEEN